MVALLNTFEGGTAGAAITPANSGGASGNPFDLVTVPAGGTAAYSANAYRGALAGEFATGATASPVFAEYRALLGVSSTGSLFGRVRARLDTLPADATGVRVAVITDSTGAFLCDVRLTNAGKVQLRNGTSVALYTSAATIAADQGFDAGFGIVNFHGSTGVLRFELYDAAGVAVESYTSPATQNTLGAGGLNRAQVGMIRSIANQRVWIDDAAWDTAGIPVLPLVTPPPTVGVGPWSGAMTDAGFAVGYQLANATGLPVRLVASTDSGLGVSPVYSASVTPNSRGLVHLVVAGLDPDTVYHYGVEVDGVLLAGGRGQARTDPPLGSRASFSLAYGSCQWDMPTAVTFAAIASYDGGYGRVRRLQHLGDFDYANNDGTATVPGIVARHLASIGSASMAGCLALLPICRVVDNHDWCGTDSHRTSPGGAAVAAAHREVFPGYALPAADGVGMWHSYVIGRVRVIALDTRTQRDPRTDPNVPGKTLLGADQLAWLKARLLDPEPVKIIMSPIYWRLDSLTGDRWGSYPDEWGEVRAYILALPPRLRRLVVGFGDRHALAGDIGDGTSGHQTYLPQGGGAPFQQGSTPSSETWSAGYYDGGGAVTLQAFGVFDVADAGDTITVTYRGITAADGVQRLVMPVTFDLTQDIGPAGAIASGEAIGTPAIAVGAAAAIAGAGGIDAPAPAFGGPVVAVAAAHQVGGAGQIASGEAFGSPLVDVDQAHAVAPAGIASGEAIGTPAVEAVGVQTVRPEAITSGEAFGAASVALGAAQQVYASGMPTGEAFGTATITTTGDDVAACEPWPVDTTCLPPGWSADPAQWTDKQKAARDIAQGILAPLAVRAYGLCARLVRPCSVRCASAAGYQLAGRQWFVPALVGGRVVNGCGCVASRCGCGPLSEVLLPGPVYDVLSVKVDGLIVPPTAYRVDDGLRLVRTDGVPWPTWQDLAAPPEQLGTFAVEYRRGVPLPAAGRRALTAYTVEIHKGMCGDPACRLPARVTNITREGTTYSLLDDPNVMLDQGRTGVPEVDAWLASVNPYKIKSEMRVWSPDMATPRRTRGTL
ncbi:hypothetical protein [Micromonospora sp. NPDC049645]|uniref:hypothetical protein n=1 Tax=Micromonospora sp. NPDC049645 TaxID=3155508 RepID=UPI00342B9FBE